MPTTTGAAALPSPLAAEAPDGPGGFLALVQRISATVDPVATVGALPASGAFTGQRLPVLSTPGAVWEWSGAAWVMTGTATFASAAARSEAIASPVLGMHVRIANTTLQRYDGSTWVNVLEDTGWANVPLTNSAVAESGNPFQYKRLNGVVYFRGRVQPISNASGTSFAALAVGFRPAGNTGASGSNLYIVDSGGPVRVNIPTDTGVAALAGTGAGLISLSSVSFPAA